MKHIIEFIFTLITTVSKYFITLLVLIFDGVMFGWFLMAINNNVLARIYSVPKITYIDAVLIIFMVKLITLMIKSVNLDNNENEEN